MSAEQREQLDAVLRQGVFPATTDVNEQRRQLRALLSAMLDEAVAALDRAGRLLSRRLAGAKPVTA